MPDFARFYRGGTRISSAEARRIAEGWGEWKGLVAFYLDIAEHLHVSPG